MRNLRIIDASRSSADLIYSAADRSDDGLNEYFLTLSSLSHHGLRQASESKLGVKGHGRTRWW